MIQRPDWQALLFVPVGAERHLASAILHRPDAVILDLEDAVAPDAKAAARIVGRAAQSQLAEAGIDCVLRVNGAIRAMVEDLNAADHSLLQAVMVPKCEDAHPLRNAADLTDGAIGLIALVESPAGLQRLTEIAAVPQVVALMLGSEDCSAALGVDPDRGALDLIAAQLAVAAAPRGLIPIGFPGSIANFRDLERIAFNLDQIAGNPRQASHWEYCVLRSRFAIRGSGCPGNRVRLAKGMQLNASRSRATNLWLPNPALARHPALCKPAARVAG